MQAIILKKNIFSEGNEIITLYTKELGKVRAVAKSVKSPKSRLAFALQNLFYTDVDLLLSKKLSTIKGVKPLDTFPSIYSDSEKIVLALYATEIILKSTADEQPNEPLFESYLQLLRHLNESNSKVHLCSDFFVLRALALNGYALEYENCALCGREMGESEQVYFSIRKGGFVCEQDADKATDAQSLSHNLYLALRQNQDTEFNTVDNLGIENDELHKLVQGFATYILERDLNTPEYLGKL